MRLAFIGASHWHVPMYVGPALQVPGAEIVGVSDPDAVAVERWTRELGCSGSTDFRDLCRTVRPDFVFAFGRHCDMADEARFLIDRGIPFALEKPCGVDPGEVRDLAERAADAKAFAAVALVFRNGPLVETVREIAGDGDFRHMAFRFIAGPPSRYIEADCAWMLDPALSGGGPTINLSVHFLDLCRTLMGPDARVVAATMSNATWNLPIEDYSSVTLMSERSTCLIETGYLYPAPTSTFDQHFALRSVRHYFVVPDAHTLEIFSDTGERDTRAISTTNVPHYRDFVVDVLDRVAAGRRPLANLSDMVPLLEYTTEAYALAERASGVAFNGRPAGPFLRKDRR